jgi:hypothetical protein
MRNSYNILVRKCEVKKPFGRLKLTWEDNIEMAVKEMVHVCVHAYVYWIHMGENSD